MTANPNAPLIPGLAQAEVDFVIPRAGVDLPLGIDPFLLFKSRDPTLAELHRVVLAAFNRGVDAIRTGDAATARRILHYPEVSEIALGYTQAGRRGSGVGEFLTELLIESILETPAILENGVRHVEEMQLVSVGIGPDRVSDIVANIIKRQLILYTQAQARMWDVPLKTGVPLHNIWNAEAAVWEDEYIDLPISPVDGQPLLFVPRRIVRALPWINYDDFLRLEFQTYLRAKRVRGRLARKKKRADTPAPPKPEVVQTARRDYQRVRSYVARKEAARAKAQPSAGYLELSPICDETNRLEDKLRQILVGHATAAQYQRTVLEILNTCFNPELIDGQLEVKTIHGTERRDIIFVNDSDHTFWDYVRNEHSSLLVMFEAKNVQQLTTDDLNQTATYLGDRIGRLGFIVTRHAMPDPLFQKALSIYNESPRKIILALSDDDLIRLLEIVCREDDPTAYIRDRYREFRQSAQ